MNTIPIVVLLVSIVWAGVGSSEGIQDTHRRIQGALARNGGPVQRFTLQPKKDLGLSEVSLEVLSGVIREGEFRRAAEMRNARTGAAKKAIRETEAYWPWADLRLPAGSIGDCVTLHVLQVVGKSNLLVTNESDSDSLFWVDGFEVGEAVDNTDVSLTGPIIVRGVHQYETVTGATKTIPVIRPLVVSPEVLAEAKLLAGKPSKKPADQGSKTPEATSLRTWTAAGGKYTIVARFRGAVMGQVKLEKEGGEVITVPLAKLSDGDQAYIRDRSKAASPPANKPPAERPNQ